MDNHEIEGGELFNEVMLACSMPQRMLSKGENSKQINSQNETGHAKLQLGKIMDSGIQGPQNNKAAKWQIRNTQQLLTKSTKFVVSDSLLEHAVLASNVAPKLLLEACARAMPPIDTMWIEWNEHKRVDLLCKYYLKKGINVDPQDDEDRAERVGYLIDPVKGLNMYSTFFRDKTGKIALPINAFYIKNESQITSKEFVTERKTQSNSPNETLEFFESHQEEFGRTLFGKVYTDKLFGEKKHKKYIDALCRRTAFGLHPLAEAAYVPQFVRPMYYDIDIKMETWFKMTIEMNMGDARFLIALLSLINYPNILIERDLQLGPQRMVAGRRVPRNEMRVIELDLPKPRGVTTYQRMFNGMGAPKRQHVRRGHIRVVKHKDGTQTERWIPQMVVGDPSLGRIDHQYDLKSKGSKNDNKT